MSSEREPPARDAPTPDANSSTEDEPLLGRRGDVAQRPTDHLLKNLVTGTAPFAQFGGLLILGLVWGAIFTHPRILFSAHPLLNSLAILTAIQAVLVLQPTHTPEQKRSGTLTHAALWAVALALAYAALIVIEVHKHNIKRAHFESPHAIAGAVTYLLLLMQALVGIVQYFVPAVVGGVENGKALYRWHRISGYLILALLLVDVVLASQTYYAGSILGIKTWATVVGLAFVVTGAAPRIKKQKVQLWGMN